MSSTVIGQILHFCLDICKNERSQTNAIHLRCRYSKTSEFGSLCNKCQFTTKPKIAFEQQTGFDQTETLCPYSFVSPRYMCSKNQEFIYNISDFPFDPLGGRKGKPNEGQVQVEGDVDSNKCLRGMTRNSLLSHQVLHHSCNTSFGSPQIAPCAYPRYLDI